MDYYDEPWVPQPWNDQTDLPPWGSQTPSLSSRLNQLYYMHKYRAKFNVNLPGMAKAVVYSAVAAKLWLSPGEEAFLSHVIKYPDEDLAEEFFEVFEH